MEASKNDITPKEIAKGSEVSAWTLQRIEVDTCFDFRGWYT